MIITESLRANDLQYLIRDVFEIDSYKSKMGDDSEIIVLSFTAEDEDPAKDFEHFVELGYSFVIDADVSPGETENNDFKIYIEIERTQHAAEQIIELLDGVKKITGIEDFRFRYFKSFRSQEATLENLKNIIPTNSKEYKDATTKFHMENFSNFFASSYTDNIELLGESLTFKRIRMEPVTFKIITSGPKTDVYNAITGPMMLESSDIAEVLYLTKSIGNYNINKIGNTFVFENNGWAVALEKK